MPQVWLRRFADEREFIVARKRFEDVELPPTSVRKHCREKEFNRIEFDSGVPEIDENPHTAEELYCFYEGATSPLFDRLEEGRIDLSAHERSQLSFFLAMQTSRTWHFRTALGELFDMAARHHAAGEISEESIERFRRTHPEADYASNEAFREVLRAGQMGNFELTNDMFVQQSLRFAAGAGFSAVHSRRWRLLMFETPCLGISDNPIGLWSPFEKSDDPLSLANATAYFVPIGRSAALSMSVGPGPDSVHHSVPARAKQINYSVAADAEKWLYFHPDDRPFDNLDLPGPAQYVDELVSRQDQPDGTVRERRRFTRRRGAVSE